MLAKITRQSQAAEARRLCAETLDDLPRLVAAAVVDEKDLVVDVGARDQTSGDVRAESLERGFLVVDRRDDRYARRNARGVCTHIFSISISVNRRRNFVQNADQPSLPARAGFAFAVRERNRAAVAYSNGRVVCGRSG